MTPSTPTPAAVNQAELGTPRHSRGNALGRVISRGETIRLMIGAQLKSGHRDKILGHFWSLLDPILSLAVYYLVFGIGFRQAGDSPSEFVLYLFAGIVAWRFFGETVAQASGALRSHRSLILSADFPKAVIPIAICGARLYDLLWALLVVIVVVALSGTLPTLALVWLPLIVLVQVALTLGLSFIVAYLGLFFADTANLIAAFLRLWVLACPIFYFGRSEHGRIGIIPDELIDYYMLNPMAGLLGAYRSVLVWGEQPNMSDLIYVTVFATILLGAGFTLFNRGEGQFAKFV